MTVNYIWLVICHLIGDYVLQSDFIAKTKGENRYHMVVHSVLYCVPFILSFGMSWKIMFLYATHVMIDSAKARYHFISYEIDQFLHYFALLIFFV